MKSVKYTGPMEVFKHFQIDQPFRHYMNPEKTNYIETNNEPNFMVDRQFAQDLSSDSKSKWHIEYQFGIQTILGAETPSAIRERLMTKKSTLKYIK
ncbi:MAG: hypothetical protein KAS04_06165, partial [Candidatus Aenigmarchaeota archaeon]|nr:hypothetical protein [Candidatus Aenigmarchaeota archaeon]